MANLDKRIQVYNPIKRPEPGWQERHFETQRTEVLPYSNQGSAGLHTLFANMSPYASPAQHLPTYEYERKYFRTEVQRTKREKRPEKKEREAMVGSGSGLA